MQKLQMSSWVPFHSWTTGSFGDPPLWAGPMKRTILLERLIRWQKHLSTPFKSLSLGTGFDPVDRWQYGWLEIQRGSRFENSLRLSQRKDGADTRAIYRPQRPWWRINPDNYSQVWLRSEKDRNQTTPRVRLSRWCYEHIDEMKASKMKKPHQPDENRPICHKTLAFIDDTNAPIEIAWTISLIRALILKKI